VKPCTSAMGKLLLQRWRQEEGFDAPPPWPGVKAEGAGGLGESPLAALARTLAQNAEAPDRCVRAARAPPRARAAQIGRVSVAARRRAAARVGARGRPAAACTRPACPWVVGGRRLTLSAAAPCARRVQFTPAYKVTHHVAKPHFVSVNAASRPATLARAPSSGGAAEAPMPRSPAASRPQPSPRAPKSAAGKSPRAAPLPGAAPPSAKRARRDGAFGPRKASTPATPSGSLSGSEEAGNGFGAGGAASAPRRSDDAQPTPRGRSTAALAAAAETEDPDAALARRLHAELNCTPARTSRVRAAAACAITAAPRDRAHGNDPGLLPSC